MKKFVATILLLVFVTSQYARHISYLECRLTNYISDSDRKCDCEKIISDTGKDSSSVPATHRHIHFEDNYFNIHTADYSFKKYQPGLINKYNTCEMLWEGIPTGCYHPPRATS